MDAEQKSHFGVPTVDVSFQETAEKNRENGFPEGAGQKEFPAKGRTTFVR